jgi:hypothetical protein
MPGLKLQNLAGPLFFPLIYRLAARLEQLSWQELTENVDDAVYALQSAQQLFGLKVLASTFRIGFEAEACGAELGRDSEGSWVDAVTLADPARAAAAPGALPIVASTLEATTRLCKALGDRASVAGVLTGPRTLSHLFSSLPEGLGGLYAAIARAYAEAGVQLLLVAEDPRWPTVAADDGVLKQVLNVAGYFGLPAVLLDSSRDQSAGGFTLTIGRDSPQALPVEKLASKPEGAQAWKSQRQLITTAWEVPPETPPEAMRAWSGFLNAP